MKKGFTCGAFDLLHAGHIVMLMEAKENCDYLIVGLQTDPSLDRKEKNKPVQSIYERYIQLNAIKYIDEILPYDTEKSLLDLLEANILPNKKRILFKLYQSIAFSSQGKENLYKIWDRSLKFQSLKLNETDYTSLAMRLAIFKHENSEDILNTQAINITNKDRLSRFMWLLPSLSQDISIRDAFMDSLKKVKNREKESWVVMALNNIHHPLRHESSTKHIKLCLELLEEIQLTGDIFFPKNWLLNSIGNYSSKEALVILKDFLNDNPEFSPILKKKLLQSADGLFRVQKLHKD